jgi:hypothetical protein
MRKTKSKQHYTEVNKMEKTNNKPETVGTNELEKCIVCNKKITGKKEYLFLDQNPRTDGPIEYWGLGSQKRLSCSLGCFLKDAVAAQKELMDGLKEGQGKEEPQKAEIMIVSMDRLCFNCRDFCVEPNGRYNEDTSQWYCCKACEDEDLGRRDECDFYLSHPDAF